jgi:hypothetical protein
MSALGGTIGRAAGCPASVLPPCGRGAIGAPGVNIGEAGGLAGAGRRSEGVPGVAAGPAAPGVVKPAGGVCRVAGRTIATGAAGALGGGGAGACGKGIGGPATFVVSGAGIGCRGPVVVTPGLACGIGRAGTESGRFATPLEGGVAGLASGGCSALPPPNGGRNG